MATKLTLTIDKPVIQKAKTFAQRKRKSVSKIVEEYLKLVTDNKKDTNLPDFKINAPITESLVGKFKDNGKDYKEMLAEIRSERHL